MSSSQASLEALRDLQKALASTGNQGPVVLAINDGEASEVARRVAAENALSAIVVPDPRQDISSAYGVNIWPTTIFLDDRGMVSNIRYGRFAAELAAYASQAKAASGYPPRRRVRQRPGKPRRKAWSGREERAELRRSSAQWLIPM
jgi:hypothetical protein